MILLASRSSRLVEAVNWDSDPASAYVIADSLANGAHGVVMNPNGDYTPLLFGILTHWIPGHRQLWEAAPYGLAICSAAVLGWAVWRLAGRLPGLTAAAIAIAAGPTALPILLRADYHNTTWIGTVVLGAYLVFLGTSGTRWGRRGQVASAVAVALFVGTSVASDSLLIVTGMVPFVLASLALLHLTPGARARRIGALALGTAAMAAAVAVATSALARAVGVSTLPPEARFAAAGDIARNVGWMIEAVVRIGNGDFFGQPLGAHGILAFMCAGLALAGFAVPFALLRWIRWERSPLGSQREGMTLHLVFWPSVTLTTCASFVFSTRAIDIFGARFLMPVLYAGAATVPLLLVASTRARLAAAVGASVVLLSSVVSLADRRSEASPQPGISAHAGELKAILRRERVTRGYAGYWYASSLTWHTKLEIKARPVFECQRTTLCRERLNRVSSWYRPQPRVRSFLIVDPAGLFVTHLPSAAVYGNPTGGYHLGSLQLYIYPYDIASKFAG